MGKGIGRGVIAPDPLEVPAGIEPDIVLVIYIQAAGDLVVTDYILEPGRPKDDGMGPAVYLLEQAVLVHDPAVAVMVFAGVGDQSPGEAAGAGAILLDGKDFPGDVQVIDTAVAIDEPITGRAAGDTQEPEFGQGMSAEIAGVVAVELIGREIIDIEPAGAGLDPHFPFGAFEDLFDIVVADGVGVVLVVAEDFKLVAVVSIQAGHGAEPQEAAGVFIEAGDVVVGKAVGKVEGRKLIFSRLRK